MDSALWVLLQFIKSDGLVAAKSWHCPSPTVNVWPVTHGVDRRPLA